MNGHCRLCPNRCPWRIGSATNLSVFQLYKVVTMRIEHDIDGPASSGGAPPRRPGRRGIAILAGAILVAGATWVVIDHHRACACALPPVPNMTAFHYAARMAAAGNHERARDVFDMLVNDPNSGIYRSVALYGRGVSRRAIGDVAGGEADIGAATRSEPGARRLYEAFAPGGSEAQVPATR
jgi:hypothetical protein